MSDLSRREFLRKGSVGVATGVVAARLVTDGAIASAAAREPGTVDDGPEDARSDEPVIAVVKRGSHGDVTLMVGSTEVVRKDADLARRILRASKH